MAAILYFTSDPLSFLPLYLLLEPSTSRTTRFADLSLDTKIPFVVCTLFGPWRVSNVVPNTLLSMVDFPEFCDPITETIL